MRECDPRNRVFGYEAGTKGDGRDSLNFQGSGTIILQDTTGVRGKIHSIGDIKQQAGGLQSEIRCRDEDVKP